MTRRDEPTAGATQSNKIKVNFEVKLKQFHKRDSQAASNRKKGKPSHNGVQFTGGQHQNICPVRQHAGVKAVAEGDRAVFAG